nr:hypothetical protein DSAG12_01446 [Candidatus Prometheoarchaeum syntrophicum]
MIFKKKHKENEEIENLYKRDINKLKTIKKRALVKKINQDYDIRKFYENYMSIIKNGFIKKPKMSRK